MLEVSWPLAVLELGTLLDQELNVLWMSGEKRQEGHDSACHLLQTVLNSGDAGQDLLLHLPHHPIRGGQKKLALAGEVFVNRSLAKLQSFGKSLRYSI